MTLKLDFSVSLVTLGSVKSIGFAQEWEWGWWWGWGSAGTVRWWW